MGLIGELDSSPSDLSRSNTKQISEILANMKGFISYSSAKFILIGGEDFYIGSLSDNTNFSTIANSLFDHVFFIKSFLSDRQEYYNKHKNHDKIKENKYIINIEYLMRKTKCLIKRRKKQLC